ncbi:NERD domain-containing protein [Patescibacteria group bacterium]|nr:NERD domain-containing protein [Patescibacteria group bacterium]
MRVVRKDSSYSSDQINKINKDIDFSKSLIGVGILILFWFLFFNTNQNYWWVFAVAIIFVSIGFVTNISLSRRAGRFFAGNYGEEKLLTILKKYVSDEYVYIPNYKNLEFKQGDIDGILIGPTGLFLFEVKNWSGTFRVSGHDIYKHVGRELYQLYKSPFDQLNNSVSTMTNFLLKNGLNINPKPVIILVNGRVEAFRGQTGIYLTNLYGLTNNFLKTYSKKELSEDQIEKLVKLFS